MRFPRTTSGFASLAIAALGLLSSPAAGAQDLYVANSQANTVSVVDTSTNSVVATIPVGNQPTGVAILPNGKKVYISNYQDSTVSVIDTSTNTVIKTITGFGLPQGLAATLDGKQIYVAGEGFSVIDTATDTVKYVPCCADTRSVAMSQDGTTAYLTTIYNNSNNAAVYAVDVATTSESGIVNNCDCTANSIAITPNGSTGYFDDGTALLYYFDTATLTATMLTPYTYNCPCYEAVTPDGSQLWVANGYITIFSTSNNTVLKQSVGVGTGAGPIAFSSDGKVAYTIEYGDGVDPGDVVAIDTATYAILNVIPVGAGAIAIGNFIGLAGGGACGDGDQLIQEYITYHNKFVPTCSDFTTSASGPVYTFSMLNSSYNYSAGMPYSHILLNIVLVQPAAAGPGLDLWLHNIEGQPNYQFHAINSGYRNPEKQAMIYKNKKKKVVESQHVYGDAVDLQNISMTHSEYDMLRKTAFMAGASWVEDFSGPKAPCKNVCVHADWRKLPKIFAQ